MTESLQKLKLFTLRLTCAMGWLNCITKVYRIEISKWRISYLVVKVLNCVILDRQVLRFLIQVVRNALLSIKKRYSNNLKNILQWCTDLLKWLTDISITKLIPKPTSGCLDASSFQCVSTSILFKMRKR